MLTEWHVVNHGSRAATFMGVKSPHIDTIHGTKHHIHTVKESLCTTELTPWALDCWEDWPTGGSLTGGHGVSKTVS